MLLRHPVISDHKSIHIFPAETCRGGHGGIKKPERHIHALYRLNPAFRNETSRQKNLSLIKIFECRLGIFLRFLKRNHIVGTKTSAVSLGNHRRISAITALRSNRILITNNFRTARRTGKGAENFFFLVAPVLSRFLRIPFF